MDCTMKFSGGKTKTDLFKRDLFKFTKSINRFFEFDGETLKADFTEDEKKKIEFFVNKYGGQIIVE